jgi:hypothetical protein
MEPSPVFSDTVPVQNQSQMSFWVILYKTHYFFSVCGLLGIEHRAWHLLGKRSTSEALPPPK